MVIMKISDSARAKHGPSASKVSMNQTKEVATTLD